MSMTCQRPAYFNPHSRVGSDLTGTGTVTEQHDFNPHSRVGSDSKLNILRNIISISIHTPA